MGKFKFSETPVDGLYIAEPMVFEDSRGYNYESYNQDDFKKAGLNMDFVQDNESRSVKGVLRGLHFQKKHPQGKLVRVLTGEVYDVAVDLRQNSKTFCKWHGLILSAENKKQFYIPEGFAHGFLVLSDYAVFAYKMSDFYYPDDQDGIIWNDPELDVKWPVIDNLEIILSEKDKVLKTLNEYLKDI